MPDAKDGAVASAIRVPARRQPFADCCAHIPSAAEIGASPGMWHVRYALEQSNRLRVLPALARDAGAAAIVLAFFAVAMTLPAVTVPAAAVVMLPVLLLAAVAFGRDSALLAALLAALAVKFQVFSPAEGAVRLLPIAVLSSAALAVAALLEELRRSRAEAATANLRSDATARRAAERVEVARQQLREAEARLVEAERKARQDGHGRRAAVRAGSQDPALESAFRSEGGV